MKKLFIITLFLTAFVFPGISQDLSGVKIYINPGHGGYDSDDRNVVISPYTQGDQNGFWESKSNLDKGKYLKAMLEALGATAFISRVSNTTADDLPLSQIVASANASNADFMLSIHSNAGAGVANHVLMLYSGVDTGDTHVYPTPTPYSEISKAISTEIAKNLYSNQATNWNSTYSVRGDKTFGRTAMGGWSDGYGVLRGLTVPGVISEGSMHDYIPETYRLMNMEYKWMEAWNFLKSFTTYFKSASLPKGNIAGTVKDKYLLSQAGYYKLPNTHDLLLPVNGSTVTLLPKDTTYTVDNLNNGFFLFKNLDPGLYTLITRHPEYHNDTTTVQVTANQITYAQVRPNKVRNTPPAVVEYSPKALTADTLMLASSVIRFKFNWDVDVESAKSAFSISPAVAGQFVFKESNFVMEFVPNMPLDTTTVYTVKLAKTLKHYDGLSMVEDFTFSFKTMNRNKLSVLASYPLAGEINIDYKSPTFTFVFDKKLQTSELNSGVQVYDKQGKALPKIVRTVRNNLAPEPLGSTSFTLAQDLIPGQEYVLKLAKGIKDVDGVYLTDTLNFPFKASDERITDKPVVETFETAGKLKVDTLASNLMVTATTQTSSSTKLFNSYSYNLRYSFLESEAGSVVYRFIEPNIEVTNDSTVGLHIYGDLSGNELYLIFESESDIKDVKLDSIHYGGWKFAEVTLSDLLPGKNYKLTALKFLQKKAPLSMAGNVFIDNLLVFDKSQTSVSTENVIHAEVYPNPANDMLYTTVNEGQNVEKVELFTLNAQLIRTTQNDFLRVSGVPSGTYIVKIKLNVGVLSKPVIIVH